MARERSETVRWRALRRGRVLVGLVVASALLAGAGCGHASRQARPTGSTVRSTPTGSVPTAPGAAPASGTAGPIRSLVGSPLYVDPNNPAARQLHAWAGANSDEPARTLHRIADRPSAHWAAGSPTDAATIADLVGRAARAGQVPIIVGYNIPHRDCGQFAAGGTTPEQYRRWIGAMADAIGDRAAVVILEPDAIAQFTMCLSPPQAAERAGLLRQAVQALKTHPHTWVYLDAGNPRWHPAEEVARLLLKAGIQEADGFALNVANFIDTDENVAYGVRLSALVGNRHFVVDTSRNGPGAALPAPSPRDPHPWCNPRGRALGQPPSTSTGHALVDAFLWIKVPGESDGACRANDPPAGAWWPEYALELARNAPVDLAARTRASPE